MQEKLLLHDLSLATIQSILLLSSKEAHWSCQFWLQCETSNLGLQQWKSCLLQTEIYLGWGGAGCRRKNNRAETFLEAERQESWCESSTGCPAECSPWCWVLRRALTQMLLVCPWSPRNLWSGREAFHTSASSSSPGISDPHLVVFSDRFVAPCSLRFRATLCLTQEQTLFSSFLHRFHNQCNFSDPLLLYHWGNQI